MRRDIIQHLLGIENVRTARNDHGKPTEDLTKGELVKPIDKLISSDFFPRQDDRVFPVNPGPWH